MNKVPLYMLFLFLLAFCSANAAKRSLAVMPCVGDDFDAKELFQLRDKLEEVARKALPSEDFRLIPYKDVLQEVGDEELFNACAEQGVCFGNLAAQVNADYGAWCKVNNYKGKLKLKFELYSVGEKDLIYTEEYDNYNPKNYDDLVNIIKKEVPIAIREKILGIVNIDDLYEMNPYEKPETRVDTEPIKTSFWVGLGLELAGVALVYAGYTKDAEMVDAHAKYKNADGNFGDSWDKVESSRSSRDIFYAIGGALLVSGIGVHIWF